MQSLPVSSTSSANPSPSAPAATSADSATKPFQSILMQQSQAQSNASSGGDASAPVGPGGAAASAAATPTSKGTNPSAASTASAKAPTPSPGGDAKSKSAKLASHDAGVTANAKPETGQSAAAPASTTPLAAMVPTPSPQPDSVAASGVANDALTRISSSRAATSAIAVSNARLASTATDGKTIGADPLSATNANLVNNASQETDASEPLDQSSDPALDSAASDTVAAGQAGVERAATRLNPLVSSLPSTAGVHSSVLLTPSADTLQNPATTLAATPAAATPTAVAAPVGSDQFATETASKLLYFVQNNVQSAELSLNPAHLGPLTVQIRMNGDQVNLALSSAQPDTRHAIEAGLPRLREMFSEQGIQLGDLSVGARAFSQDPGSQPQTSRGYEAPSSNTPASTDVAVPSDTVSGTTHALQLVDTFA